MLFGSVIHFVYGMFGILVSGKVIELVASSFGLRKSWVLSTRALVYGSTPVYIAAILFWIPVLGSLVGLVSMIWSLRLMFRGIKALLAKSEAPRIDVIPEKSEVRERELASV